MVLQEGEEMVDLFGVESSVIAAAGYDPERRILYVVFNSGKVYEYQEVPVEIYDGLMKSESKGQFLNQKIIDIYPYRPFRGWRRD
jgi:lysyl-tRNA synthetase class 2